MFLRIVCVFQLNHESELVHFQPRGHFATCDGFLILKLFGRVFTIFIMNRPGRTRHEYLHIVHAGMVLVFIECALSFLPFLSALKKSALRDTEEFEQRNKETFVFIQRRFSCSSCPSNAFRLRPAPFCLICACVKLFFFCPSSGASGSAPHRHVQGGAHCRRTVQTARIGLPRQRYERAAREDQLSRLPRSSS